MKNKLLITTALVALVSINNAYAEDVDRKEIINSSKTLSESITGLHSTKSNGGVYFVGDTDDAVIVNVDNNVKYEDNSSTNTAGVFSVQKSHTLNIGSEVVFDGNKTTNNGGAIYANEATVNIKDGVKFVNNIAEKGQGGAIMATSKINVGNAVFEKNTAGTDGGAILNALVGGKNSSSLKLEGTTFKENTANGEGGAIASFSDLVVKNGVFDGNIAKGNEIGNYDGGGAILVGSSSTSDISNTIFKNNKADGTIGGAISTRRKHQNLDSSSLKIAQSTFSENEAADGGAIYNAFKNNVSISDSEFTNNKSSANGGAVYNEAAGVLALTGTNTFSENTAGGKLNDIHNLGNIAVSGNLTLDGGISGNGTTTFAEGSNLIVNAGTTQISNDVINKGATINLKFNNGFDGEYALISDEGSLDKEFEIAKNNLYNINSSSNGTYDVSKKSTAEIVAATGANANQASIITAVTSGSSSNATFNTVADNVGSLLQSSNTADVQTALNATIALAPEVAPLVHKTQTETTNQIFGAVSSRLSGGSVSSASQGMSSGDNVFERSAMWVQGLFSKSKLDDTSKAKGFDAKTKGIAFGFEKFVADDVKAGVGYAYSKNDIDGFMRDTDVDTHTAMVYGEYKPSDWYVNGIATYSWSDYSEKKNVLSNQIKADYDVKTYGLQAMSGYDMNVKDINVTPEAGLRYVHISQDAYKDSAGQRISGNDADILTGVIGAKASKEFTLENGMNLRPEARLAMTYDLMNDDNNSVVTLANGSAYQVNGETLDRFGIEFGAGLTADVNDNIELSVGYEGKFREDYKDHTGLLNAKYKF